MNGQTMTVRVRDHTLVYTPRRGVRVLWDGKEVGPGQGRSLSEQLLLYRLMHHIVTLEAEISGLKEQLKYLLGEGVNTVPEKPP